MEREQNELNPRCGGGLSPSPLIRLSGITKSFAGIAVLQGIDFDVFGGEVHVLLGENGAGKSTLINIIAGNYQPNSGVFSFDGRQISHLTPQRARELGIGPVFQDFSLVPELTVEENLFLGREVSRFGVFDKNSMSARARNILKTLHFDVSPKAQVSALSRAQQQMVEIAKAMLGDLKLLILDEPTSSLTERETQKLFELIRVLKSEGVGIIYISHRMAEIRQVADRITILRDGRRIATLGATEFDESRVVELMTGRVIEDLFPRIDFSPGPKVLEVEGLSLPSGRLRNVSISVRSGEIVGVAGLVGCGKSELARAVFGLEKPDGGVISLAGVPIDARTPRRMQRHGVCYFPSDREAEGLAVTRPVRENASMAALDLDAFARRGFLRLASEKAEIGKRMRRLALRPMRIESPVSTFSGGNRQKVMLARGLLRKTHVYLCDEPTVGVDVGAKAEIYELLKGFVAGGAAVLLVSSELSEILHLSHRVYVMHDGQIVRQLEGAEITEEAVLASFFQADQTPGIRHYPSGRPGPN